ncbi:MAG: rhodanese-like domain-containing protein [Bacteroidota bacterium]
MRILFLFFLASLFFACQPKQNVRNVESTEAIVEQTDKEKVSSAIKTLPPLQFKNQLEVRANAQLIDVRTPKEYNAGHLDHALNIDFFSDQFQTEIQAALDAKRPVFVYCKAGGRSAKAAKILKELGCQEIYDLAGGYIAWSRAKMNTLPDTLKATMH